MSNYAIEIIVKNKYIGICLMLILCGGACKTNSLEEVTRQLKSSPKTIYLLHKYQHARIVVPRNEVSLRLWPESYVFKNADYLSIEWGDDDAFRKRMFGWYYTLKAVLTSSERTLVIGGMSQQQFSELKGEFDIVKIRALDSEFSRLTRFIHSDYQRHENGNPIALEPTTYGKKKYYRSQKTYHLFRTSNGAVAEALEASGLPIDPDYAITGDMLMEQVLPLGELISEQPKEDTTLFAKIEYWLL